jgi:isoleucyl-tRNA synthetase
MTSKSGLGLFGSGLGPHSFRPVTESTEVAFVSHSAKLKPAVFSLFPHWSKLTNKRPVQGTLEFRAGQACRRYRRNVFNQLRASIATGGESHARTKGKKDSRDGGESPYRHTISLPETSFSQRANSTEKEPQIQRFWEENRIYETLCESTKHGGDKAQFLLHDGPPYANGSLHMGHALNKILKDIINRYFILRGKQVRFIPGWDCHGLPIELKAVQSVREKERDVLDPMQVRKLARKFALEAVEEQRKSFQRYGVWGSWRAPYLTLDPKYEAAQVQVFGEMFLKGYIYRGRKPVYWSPSSRTALAEAELEYPDSHVSRSAYVSFEVMDAGKLRASLEKFGITTLKVAVWTTTPWTIPANRAVAVNPHLRYSLVLVDDEQGAPRTALVLATDLVEVLERKWHKRLEVVETRMGSDFVGITYRHPLNGTEICRVVAGGDYISTESGTGLVHTAPGHGLEDYHVGLREALEVFAPVDELGRFTSEAGPELAGLAVLKEGNIRVLELLRAKHALIMEERYEHKYPYDWRTKEPTIVRATEQWFASVQKFRESALEALKAVQWIPSIGENRIHGMIETRDDWCISRQRPWGVPIPVFYDEETGEPIIDVNIIQHISDVFLRYGSDAWWKLPLEELLPPNSPHLSRRLRRGMDTMDVWFDSGTSWASLPLMLEGKLPFEAVSSAATPCIADLYLEGSDQHRGWFQSSLLTSVAVRGYAPYRAVLTHGFVLDEKGLKMSKSLGNVINPAEIINGGQNQKSQPALGVDVLRLWVASVDYTNDVLIGHTILKQTADAYRKIRNTLRFLAGNTPQWDDQNLRNMEECPLEKLPSLDRYMLRRAAIVLHEIEDAYDKYMFSRIFQTVLRFCVVDLSNFYLDIAKDRCYVAAPAEFRRQTCQIVMRTILTDMARSLAPILPHTAEDLWQCLRIDGKLPLSSPLSIFQSGWISNLPKPDMSAQEDQQWAIIRDVRETVNKALENARADGLIGSSLDAQVILYPHSLEVENALTSLNSANGVDDLRYIFLTSQVEVVGLAQNGTHAEGVSETRAEVRKAKGKKCARCWNYSVSVGMHPEHALVCERCIRSLQLLNVK